MLRTVSTSLRSLLVLTLVCGVAYPILVQLCARLLFPEASTGSLLIQNGQIVGSKWIAYRIESPGYFHFRPSAGDYATVPSSASNASPVSERFVTAVKERRNRLGQSAPADLLTASGSGLDPHVSIEGARYQVSRIVSERGLSPEGREQIENWITDSIERKTFGFMGRDRVNLVVLNAILDANFGKPHSAKSTE